MNLQERVVHDQFADPEYAYRAYVRHPRVELGLIDAAGPSRECALAKARRRFELRWMGVESVGMAIPEEAKTPWCGQVASNGHRFALWRRIGLGDSIVHWIMLNPSTANGDTDDATMRRVTAFSKDWGYSLLTVGNLWSYRATKPAALFKWLDTGGEWVSRTTAESDDWVAQMAVRADLVVVAWGTRGSKDRRGLAMLRFLDGLGVTPHALALTRNGQPVHPLRQPASLRPRQLAELRLETA